MVKVYIKKEIKIFFTYKKIYKKILIALTKAHNIEGDTEVNLIITNNEGIKKVSSKYKKKNKPTDVLSFSSDFRSLKDLIGYNMLGDIFISLEKVKEQAKAYGHTRKREWCYLFAHGLLHLIGFDHANAEDEKVMNNYANDLMKKIGVNR